MRERALMIAGSTLVLVVGALLVREVGLYRAALRQREVAARVVPADTVATEEQEASSPAGAAPAPRSAPSAAKRAVAPAPTPVEDEPRARSARSDPERPFVVEEIRFGSALPASQPEDQGTDDPRLQYLTTYDMSALISRGAGSPRVLVLYGTNCPISQRLIPGLQRIADEYAPRGVQFHVINNDVNEPGYDVPRFLAEAGAGFPATRLRRWRTGELSRALSSVGSSVIGYGQGHTRPVVVVWDGEGRVLAEGQGVGDARGVEAAIRAALQGGGGAP